MWWFEAFVVTVLSLHSMWFLVVSGGARKKINATKQIAAQSEKNAASLARTIETIEAELSQAVLGNMNEWRVRKALSSHPDLITVDKVTEAIKQDNSTTRSLIADAIRRTPSVISRQAVVDALLASHDNTSVNEVVRRAIKDDPRAISKEALRQAVIDISDHPTVKSHVEQILLENSTLSQILVKSYATDHLSAHSWEDVGDDEPYKTDGGAVVHLRTEQCHYCRAVNRMWVGAPPSKIKDAEGFFVNGKRWQGEGMPPCLHVVTSEGDE